MGDVAIPHAPLKPLGALKPLIHSFHSLPPLRPAVPISSIMGAGCVNKDSSDAGRDIAAYMRAVPRLDDGFVGYYSVCRSEARAGRCVRCLATLLMLNLGLTSSLKE